MQNYSSIALMNSAFSFCNYYSDYIYVDVTFVNIKYNQDMSLILINNNDKEIIKSNICLIRGNEFIK